MSKSSTHKQVYLLNPDIPCWSTAMQESIKLTRSIYVHITNTCIGSTTVFCHKLIKVSNAALSLTTGTDQSSFMDTNIEISVKSELLVPTQYKNSLISQY